MSDQAFRARVLAWLRALDDRGYRRPSTSTAVEVLAVEAHGTNWEGGTEEGFHHNFGVEIRWRAEDGKDYRLDVTGDDMEALWNHVVQTSDGEQAT